MVQVYFKEKEIKAIEELSIARDKKSIVNERFFDSTDFRVNMVGLLGELAFAKATGLPMQWDATLGGDGGIDFEFGEETVQVKTREINQRSNPDLLIEYDKAEADYYVLVDIDQNDLSRARLVGWFPHQDLKYTITNQYGKRWVVSRGSLYDIRTMITHIKELTN